MEQYIVTGMSCAACSARVEKVVTAVPGVENCSVSLLTNSMGVEGTALSSDIIKAVESAGYGAYLASEMKKNTLKNGREEMLEDRETPKLKKRLISSLCFLIPLMYISMGHMMWGWPVPRLLEDSHVMMGMIQLVLTGVVMVINRGFFVNGFKGLIRRSPNMDTLVALGSGASFTYSTYVLIVMYQAQMRGDAGLVMEYMHDFYFESAAMILTLITVGKMLEARSKGKTTDALKSLMKLAQKTAVLWKDSQEIEVPIEEVREGDIFIVRPGENIPVDGVVLEGTSAVNEALFTGESIPVDKEPGDDVFTATINQMGYIRCEATKVGEDTSLSQIIKMVSDVAATKAPIAKVADKVSGIFVPVVITIAIITTCIWMIAGQSFGFALTRGIAVLVISCPCALGLATPVAIMVGNGIGAKNGIMFKTAASLEAAGEIQIVALDKTGTITNGEPKVTDVIPAEGYDEEVVLALAYALERKSEHPLAKAIVTMASGMPLVTMNDEVTDFCAVPGNGLSGRLGKEVLYGGNQQFVSQYARVPLLYKKAAESLAEEGKTPLFFAKDKKLCGIIAVADTIKEDSARAVKELQNMGMHVVMLTGDNEKTAKTIGAKAGVDEVIAGVLPDGKEQVIRSLQKKGKVAMVGDGINDAPALTRADIGIAIGAGTDVAIDAADIVLMKSRLSDVPAAVRLSRVTLANIHQNLFWAFFYNIIGIPLAAGVWYPVFGWEMNPMFGAAAMSLSSFCVVSNALRLNLFKMYDASKDKKIKMKTIKEVEKMTKTMKIQGMMCPHCEARVKQILESFPEVEEAAVSYKEGTAVLTLSADIDNDVLADAVESQDYPVIEIK